jgi:hypothetical protein
LPIAKQLEKDVDDQITRIANNFKILAQAQ